MAQKTATKTSVKKRTSTRSMKKAAARPATDVSEEEVTMDRRRSSERRDDETNEVAAATPSAPKLERREKVNRRRQIDPTTCERDYTDQEVEFMNALDNYKRKSGRMFPTCSEVLEVINSLGYVKLSAAQMEMGSGPSIASAKPMPSELPAWDAELESEML